MHKNNKKIDELKTEFKKLQKKDCKFLDFLTEKIIDLEDINLDYKLNNYERGCN